MIKIPESLPWKMEACPTDHGPTYHIRSAPRPEGAYDIARFFARNVDEFGENCAFATHAANLYPEVMEALEKTKAHIEELREAWRTGALESCDGNQGQRSNRNVEIDVLLREVLAKAKGEQ